MNVPHSVKNRGAQHPFFWLRKSWDEKERKWRERMLQAGVKIDTGLKYVILIYWSMDNSLHFILYWSE